MMLKLVCSLGVGHNHAGDDGQRDKAEQQQQRDDRASEKRRSGDPGHTCRGLLGDTTEFRANGDQPGSWKPFLDAPGQLLK
jgi:hypothetical protein